jgi:hypothetical protein
LRRRFFFFGRRGQHGRADGIKIAHVEAGGRVAAAVDLIAVEGEVDARVAEGLAASLGLTGALRVVAGDRVDVVPGVAEDL